MRRVRRFAMMFCLQLKKIKLYVDNIRTIAQKVSENQYAFFKLPARQNLQNSVVNLKEKSVVFDQVREKCLF